MHSLDRSLALVCMHGTRNWAPAREKHPLLSQRRSPFIPPLFSGNTSHMELCIIGSGYVGLVSGACFAEVGHNVICVDNDQRKVDALQAGRIPIYEPGLEDLVHRHVAAHRLHFTNSIENGVDNSDVIFIAVPTPPQPDGSVDLSYIEKVAREIA